MLMTGKYLKVVLHLVINNVVVEMERAMLSKGEIQMNDFKPQFQHYQSINTINQFDI